MLVSIVILFVLVFCALGQSVPPETQQNSMPIDPAQNISNNVSRISRSVDELNRTWKIFVDRFSTSQGLQLTERQQKLIMALEVLNRVEQSLANMQKPKLDLTERQSKFRLQLASVTDDLLPQSLDRYVALRGTTNAEGLRDIRKQALMCEGQELSSALFQIQQELENTNQEIGRAALQVRALRGRVFSEVDKELADL